MKKKKWKPSKQAKALKKAQIKFNKVEEELKKAIKVYNTYAMKKADKTAKKILAIVEG